MPSFGDRSKQIMSKCSSDKLKSVLLEAIKHYDFSVMKTYENPPAFDLYPYPIDTSQNRFYTLAGHMKRAARKLGIAVQWGGDWITFKDLPRFELGSNMFGDLRNKTSKEIRVALEKQGFHIIDQEQLMDKLQRTRGRANADEY